jgi:hypothetical protein
VGREDGRERQGKEATQQPGLSDLPNILGGAWDLGDLDEIFI